MNNSELREKISQQLAQIDNTNLKIVAEFIDYIQYKQEIKNILPENGMLPFWQKYNLMTPRSIEFTSI